MSFLDICSWNKYEEEHVDALKKRGVDSRKIEALFAYFKSLELLNDEDEKSVSRIKSRITKMFDQSVEKEV